MEPMSCLPDILILPRLESPYQRRFLPLIGRSNPGFVSECLDLLSPPFHDRRSRRVLYFTRPKPPVIRVIQNQKELLPATYMTPEGAVNANQLYKAYQEGHTVIINDIHLLWKPLATFCLTT